MTKRMKLSVNVWTPEPIAFLLNNDSKRSDFLDYCVCRDPEEVREDLQGTFRCHGKFMIIMAATAGGEAKCKNDNYR